MLITEIKSTSQKKLRSPVLAEEPPFYMGKFESGGREHPLADELFSVLLLLYKGYEEKPACSEKRMLKACSGLLNNVICEWQSKDNFTRFKEIPDEILYEAIWWMPHRIETQADLKLHLLTTHLKNAVREVCGNKSYSQMIKTAFFMLEAGLPNNGSVTPVVWNAAAKISSEIRKRNLEPSAAKDSELCDSPTSISSTPHCVERNPAMM